MEPDNITLIDRLTRPTSFDFKRYIKVEGICYSVKHKDPATRIYWGPYHTIAEAQAVKNALTLLKSAEHGHQQRVDDYIIDLEERDY
jgi:hypothetical protein